MLNFKEKIFIIIKITKNGTEYTVKVNELR